MKILCPSKIANLQFGFYIFRTVLTVLSVVELHEHIDFICFRFCWWCMVFILPNTKNICKMLLSSDTEHHVRSGLQEAISLFCKAGFKFDVELSIDGLLAVTLDQKEVFLFNIKEIIRPDNVTAKNISCLADHENDDSCLALSPSPSDTSACGCKSDSACDANTNTTISGSRVDDNADHSAAETETESLLCKNNLQFKVCHKQDSNENVGSSSASSFPVSMESDQSLPGCSSEFEVGENQDVAEDLSLKEGERSTSSQFCSDMCKVEMDSDASSSNDQYLTGLLQNGDKLLQHIKQEPSGVANGIDDSGLPYMASLSSIRQRLGIMSQYIGMSQVVAGMHPGFISPPRTYPWSEQVLSPLASAGPVSQLANQLVSRTLILTSRPLIGFLIVTFH
jgi:hypothetical protein